MIDSKPRVHVPNADRFERIGVAADALTAAHTRDEIASWLRGAFDLDENRSADLLLAIYEALANTAEFAYPTANRRGTMDVRASYDSRESALVVTISDRGLWRTASPAPGDRSRGRGIALMKALADHASIQTSTRGTTVQLAWADITPR